MPAEPLTFTPAGSYLRVSVTRPATETKSGILLPEVSHRRPAEGTVTAVGLGRPIAGSRERTVIWPRLADVIVWDPYAFMEIMDAYDGLIDAGDVIAVVDRETGQILPENDWCALEPDAAERETKGGVLLAERSRKRARSGVVLDYGPGLIRDRGPRTGIRRSVRAMMALTDDEPLVGRRVWWEGAAKSWKLGGRCPCLMIRAGDIFAIEGE